MKKPLVIAVLLLLAACGGGGGGGGGGGSNPPPATGGPPPTNPGDIAVVSPVPSVPGTTPTPAPPPSPPPDPPPPPSPPPAPAPMPPGPPPVPGTPTYSFPRTAADPDTMAAGGFRFSAQTDRQFMAAKTAQERAAYETDSRRQYAPAIGLVSGRFVTDNHLAAIKASDAYARGATGAGETVVIADSGFYPEHREFSGAGKFTLGASFGAECTPAEIRGRTCSGPDHGTSSAGVAAARRARESTWPNMQGVAFDANIIALRLRLGGGAPTTATGPPTLTDAGDRSIVEFYERLIYRPVDASLPQDEWTYDRNNPWGFVINFSFGAPTGIDSYTRAQVREFRDRSATLFAQAHRDAADRTILVWSAGNQNRCGRGPCRYAPRPGEAAGDPVDATSPTLNTALGVHFDLPNVLVVVSVQQNGHIAASSNRCGSARAFCIAAPGVDIIAPLRGPGAASSLGGTTYPTNAYRSFSGTSAAAPVVTGALAVMRSFFRNPDGTPALGNTELVTRILATADRTDYSATDSIRPDYSDSDTYGHGLLDLDAATRPVGMLMASTSDGRRAAAESTVLEVGGAFGGAVSRRLRAVPLALFDQLDAPFFTTADRLVQESVDGGGDEFAAADAAATADAMLLRAGDDGGRRWWFAPKYNSGAPILRHPRSLLSGGGDGFGDDGGDGAAGFDGDGGSDGSPTPAFLAAHAFDAPYFALVRHGFGGGFSADAGRGRFGMTVMRGAPAAGGSERLGNAVAFGINPRGFAAGRGAFNLQAGVVQEGDGFLGARGRGAFGDARGETLFAGAGVAWGMGSWRARAAGFVGQTRADAAPGMLRGVSGLRSSAFNLALARPSAFKRGDWFGVRVGQPLRVESGRARLSIATGRTRYGVVRFSDVDVDLQPRARETQVELAWRAPPTAIAGGDLSLGVQFTRHPGHNPDADSRAFTWLRFGKEF